MKVRDLTAADIEERFLFRGVEGVLRSLSSTLNGGRVVWVKCKGNVAGKPVFARLDEEIERL